MTADQETLADTGIERTRSSAVLEPGDLVGRYVIVERLGAGGMGVVYAAYDPELDRRIALKLLHRDVGGSASTSGRQRLLREAQAMAKLSHPNVITVVDVGTLGDNVFVAMEYIDGHTLSAWLASHEPDWRETVEMFGQAGLGLIAAHDVGLVHRDFKPDNVMIDGTGRVLVLDFGLARASTETHRSHGGHNVDSWRREIADGLTRTGAMIGTPAYMSPEQHLGLPVDARSDQFSFCVALYEALYHQRPFAGASYPELALAVTKGEMRPPPTDRELPTWLRDAVVRGLQVAPGDRFASMQALWAELRRARQGRTRPALAVTLGGLGLLAMSAAIVASDTDYEPCTSGGERLAATWNDARRAQIHNQFTATKAPHATRAFKAVVHELDSYAESWASMYEATCRATQVTREQSGEMLDRRMSCLNRRAGELDVLIGVLGEADLELVAHAHETTRELVTVDRCGANVIEATDPPPPARADAVEAVNLEIARLRALLAGGRAKAAREGAEQIAEPAQATDYEPTAAAALELLGRARQADGDYEGAEQAYHAALPAAAGARDDRMAARLWARLTFLVGYQLRKPEVGRTHARAAEIALSRAENDPVIQAQLEQSMGSVAYADSRYDEARVHYQRAFELSESAHGGSDARVVPPLTGLAFVARTQGRFAEAERDYERALALQEQALGNDHPDVARTLLNLGQVHEELGDFDKARPIAERCVRVAEAGLGHQHPVLALCLRNLGRLDSKATHFAPAVARLERALSINERAYGSEHHEISNTLGNLAYVLLDAGRADEAIPMFERSVEIIEQSLGPRHSDVAIGRNNLGDALVAAGRHIEARPQYERALDVFEESLGSSHHHIAIVLDNLGKLAAHAGSPSEALNLHERGLAIRERNFGPDHRWVLSSLHHVGRVALAAGETARAVAVLKRAVSLAPGPQAERHMRFLLARAQWDAGAQKAASAEARRALALADATKETEQRQEIAAWLARHR